MYRGSAKYRDACDSGKLIYASYYRTLLELNKVQMYGYDVNVFLQKREITKYALVGCNDVTAIFAELFLAKNSVIYEVNPSRHRGNYKNCILRDYNELGKDDSIQLYIVMSNYNFNEQMEILAEKNISVSRIISVEELLADVIVTKGGCR